MSDPICKHSTFLHKNTDMSIPLEYGDMTERMMVMVFPSAHASHTFAVLQLSQNVNSLTPPFTTLMNHAAAAPNQIHLKALSDVWNSCVDKLI